jgi:hypothetical protein
MLQKVSAPRLRKSALCFITTTANYKTAAQEKWTILIRLKKCSSGKLTNYKRHSTPHARFMVLASLVIIIKKKKRHSLIESLQLLGLQFPQHPLLTLRSLTGCMQVRTHTSST